MKVPTFVTNIGLSFIRRTIIEKANFDIDELKPIKFVKKLFSPALFMHGENDDFV